MGLGKTIQTIAFLYSLYKEVCRNGVPYFTGLISCGEKKSDYTKQGICYMYLWSEIKIDSHLIQTFSLVGKNVEYNHHFSIQIMTKLV